MNRIIKYTTGFNILGFFLITVPALNPFFINNGLSSLGAIIGITLVVCSLFGELPRWVNWTQKLGTQMYMGIAIGTLILLIIYLFPTNQHESSFFAFSPSVWAAYLSIVLVTLSFRFSSIPKRIYVYCQKLRIKPFILIPLFVTLAGLLGNILDGVSIISISVIIFLGLLERKWALKASFALLFGGLISNLITVAAEPTNIKFDEVMHSQIIHIHPYYWFTNWPISILGILFPAFILGYYMFKSCVPWNPNEPSAHTLDTEGEDMDDKRELLLSSFSVLLLGFGIILHAVFTAVNLFNIDWSLWVLLLPAGIVSILDIIYLNKKAETRTHIQTEAPIRIKLMLIFPCSGLLLQFSHITLTYHQFSFFFHFQYNIFL